MPNTGISLPTSIKSVVPSCLVVQVDVSFNAKIIQHYGFENQLANTLQHTPLLHYLLGLVYILLDCHEI